MKLPPRGRQTFTTGGMAARVSLIPTGRVRTTPKKRRARARAVHCEACGQRLKSRRGSLVLHNH